MVDQDRLAARLQPEPQCSRVAAEVASEQRPEHAVSSLPPLSRERSEDPFSARRLLGREQLDEVLAAGGVELVAPHVQGAGREPRVKRAWKPMRARGMHG